MESKWREVSVSDLADLSGGYAFKSGDYAPFGRFILRTLNIADDGSISRDDAVYLPETICPQYERFSLQPHDTLFVMVGATLGKVGFVREKDLPALLNQNMWLVRARPNVADPRFVHYAFRHAIKESLGWASGSARDFVRRDDYRNLRLRVPALDEQRAIGHTLGALDDKIELNKRMNETLDAMARALFKSWFVDFEPVRAKADGREPSVAGKLAELFPDSLSRTELGEIPDGWRIVPLSEVCNINPARILRKNEPAPYIDMAAIPTRGHSPGSWIRRSYGSGARFENGDTLMARITPCLENGKTAYIDVLQEREVGWGSTEYIVLRPKRPLPNEYAYCLARSEPFREAAIRSMTGSSGRQRVPVEAVAAFNVAMPPASIAEAFGKAISPLFARMKQGASESRVLAEMRDALLPKLVSGEIRVGGT